MSVAHLIQRLLLVLTISNLWNSRHLELLLSPLIVLLVSFFLSLDMDLLSVGGIF
jgi:hypothetical protein